MQAENRLLDIEEKFGSAVERIVPVELDESTLKVILYLKDGSNVRVTEQWKESRLIRYSYYWLTSDNTLRVGWDNAPHHKKLESFPHHKHINLQINMHPSKETCLEEVMEEILPSSKDSTSV